MNNQLYDYSVYINRMGINITDTEYICEVCRNKYSLEYFDRKQKKCFMHCEKTRSNSWYNLDDGNIKIWKKDKINLFWSCIQRELTNIAGINSDSNTKNIGKYEFKHVIFPEHQEDYDYVPSRGHKSDLATNFYSYYEYLNMEDNIVEEYNTIETLQLKFIDCTFLEVADFRKYTFNKDIFFFNCTFYEKVLLGNKFSHKLSFKECDFNNQKLYLENKIFEDTVILRSCEKINEITLKESTFKSKVKIQSSTIVSMANFYNTKFEDLADFYETNFNSVDFERTDFNKISIFSETTFNESVDFKYTKFIGKAIFRDTIFCETLNLRNAIFDDDALFLDVTSEVGKIKSIEVENRETARVIKNFLDNSNNLIEANKFYTLEMKEREEELNKSRKDKRDIFEWITFKIHSISSNHSQDWVLAFKWIIIFGFISSLVSFYSIQDDSLTYIHLTSDSAIKLIGLVGAALWLKFVIQDKILNINKLTIVFMYLIYYFITKDMFLFMFSQTLNPFSIMQSNANINVLQLIFKIIIAYLIYQLIVSVRQNTRRK